MFIAVVLAALQKILIEPDVEPLAWAAWNFNLRRAKPAEGFCSKLFMYIRLLACLEVIKFPCIKSAQWNNSINGFGSEP